MPPWVHLAYGPMASPPEARRQPKIGLTRRPARPLRLPALWVGPRRARQAVADRFLTVPMAAGLALYGAFALTFAQFQVKGDALVYYNLLRRFFREGPDFAFAYQFGSDVWNAPFFLVGK